ncbi:MAG: SMC-Scp complex subunit ScpB [Angelakisella sp.]
MKLTERQKEMFAVLFAAGEPMETSRLAEALEIHTSEVEDCADGISAELAAEGLPLVLRKLEDSYQLCTATQFAAVIRKALEIRRNIPLSAAAMEVLAIIAYNQPVSRSFLEQVRGVDSSSVVVSLVEKGLVEEAGRMDLPGRPIAYRTTAGFLRCFGLAGLSELPVIEDEPEEAAPVEAEEQLTFGQ